MWQANAAASDMPMMARAALDHIERRWRTALLMAIMNISRFRVFRDRSCKHLSDFSKMQPVRDRAATRNGTTPGSPCD
jgi:hypothetical protein